MKLSPFKLERYFAQYEFSVQYLLSSSDCDGIPQKDILALADPETKELWDNLALGYTESLGHPLLREEIAHIYTGISARDCLVVAPEEGIFIALNAILDRGDHVICTFPGYQSLYEIAAGIGCEVTLWKPEEENGWRFDPDFLEEHIQPNTKLMIVNFPHNPTGYLPPKGDFQRIVDLAQKHHLYLFSDEMYRFLEYDHQDRLPSACEVYDRAVSLFGMSKTFGMAGVRIGWVVTRDADWFARMAAFKDYTTICSSAPSEILSLIVLRSREKIIATHRARIQRNLGLLDRFFEDHADRFEWVRPRAGTIAFPRLKEDRDALDFCQQVVREANIMLLPSTVYDFDSHHFRLGFGRENLPEALEKLEAYLQFNPK
ncbi:aspartate/tyrosine/aromatic aminotransferase [Longilinea arvoryzae]|uniref:Aspartate/tyrosine/aromatic aminotransferase n=1 Tax=Longilinea arvoryzae TaxID=360412 RepID=A0A0S7BEN8_9CHLR|nr:aminotransferase class I/II-fold pyridoxal phosphate-dependent enzyme [Longilinea arvoryzae]GAP12504.1 aspartate/tyrosine/aromatic aminotransferase [Longilinea arvoryzae]